jgi:hypothetical protein
MFIADGAMQAINIFDFDGTLTTERAVSCTIFSREKKL